MPEIVIGVLLAIAGIVWRLVGWKYPTESLQLWQLVTYSGVFYLVIGLLRDLYIKYIGKPEACEVRRASEPTMCLESCIGPVVVMAGLAMLLAGVRQAFHPSVPALGIAAGALFAVSGMLKNVVVAFRIEKNHISFIPW